MCRCGRRNGLRLRGRWLVTTPQVAGVEEVALPPLGFDPEDLAGAMRDTYSLLIAFVNTPAFLRAYAELFDLPSKERPAFVTAVFLNPEERARRGIEVPDGVLIQKSAFGDRRPTLFAVKKFLPPKFHGVWENVN